MQMLDMEAQVLNALEYRIASTTCYGFMHRYMQAGCTTDKQRSLVLVRALLSMVRASLDGAMLTSFSFAYVAVPL